MALSPQERSRLVELAREAVRAEVSAQPKPTAGQAEGALAEMRGCFVTLTNAGRLRGCIGTFRPDRPLAEMIVEMGAAAARDPRFIHHAPILPEEVDQLAVEVSVLSPLEPTDDPLSLEVGTHGIYVVSGHQAGCFLPEVATDQGWGAEEFLRQCCAGKAQLPPDAWQRPDATVYLFTSEKFGT